MAQVCSGGLGGLIAVGGLVGGPAWSLGAVGLGEVVGPIVGLGSGVPSGLVLAPVVPPGAGEFGGSAWLSRPLVAQVVANTATATTTRTTPAPVSRAGHFDVFVLFSIDVPFDRHSRSVTGHGVAAGV